jgi:putative tryptophan/tyrosine transport system substrate-binding protein
MAMRRRAFIAALGGAAAMWPLAVRAQQPATQRRTAIFHPAIPTTLLTETGGGSALRAFFGELRRLGYVEGENRIIERYSAEGHHERYADWVREIVTRNPDVIVNQTAPGDQARPRDCFVRAQPPRSRHRPETSHALRTEPRT